MEGVIAAVPTPVDENLAPLKDLFVEHCAWALENGCDGLNILGSTGEANSFDGDSRRQVMTWAAEALPNNRLMVGTGTPSLAETITLTEHADDLGYSVALALPPYYYKNPSDEGLYAHYATLIDKIGRDDLRIYMYHFPQMSQVPFSVELVLRLKAEFGPIIAGLKDSSGDFSQSKAFIEATGGVDQDFDVYPSSEAFLWDGLSIGSAGIISGSTNIFANLVQAARTAPEGAERDAAMAAVTKARTTAAGYPLMAAMKTAEYWRTGDEGWLRMQPPLRPLSDDQKAALKADLAALKTPEPVS